MVTNKIRQWFVFFRAHTGTLEAPIAALGAATAVGTLFDPRVALWTLIGLLYHYAGYGQNSYYDWKNGHDKDDPHKQHHPLNTGDIKPSAAKWAANSAVLAYLVATLWLVRFNLVGIAITLAAFVCGLGYNLVGKKVKHKHLLLSISHSSLFLIPYSTYATLDLFALLIFIALVVQHTFQIAISGDIKDIHQDESSILSDLGIKLRLMSLFGGEAEYRIRTSDKARLTVAVLTAIQICIVLSAISGDFINTASSITKAVTFALVASGSIALMYLSGLVIHSGRYKRPKRLQYISMREVVGFWLIYVATIPFIGINGYLIALILSVCYVIIHSKFMWGTYLRPKV